MTVPKHTLSFVFIAPQDTSAPKVISPTINMLRIPFLPPEDPATQQQKAKNDTVTSKRTRKSKTEKSLKKDKKEKTETSAKAEKKELKTSLPETVIVKQVEKKAVPKAVYTVSKPKETERAKAPSGQTLYTESIFSGHLLHTSRISPIVKPVENKDWSLVILLAVFSLLAILNTLYRKRMRLLFNALTSNRFVNQLMREENPLSQRASIFLSILYVFSFSLFIFKLHGYYQLNLIQETGFVQFLILLACVVAFYFMKIVIHRFLGMILKIEKETNEYVFNLFLSNQFVGLALIPVLVALLFYNYTSAGNLFSIGLVLIVASFTYRTVRGLRLAVSNNSIAKSYLFIYLCTLEILPMVVLAKVLINKM